MWYDGKKKRFSVLYPKVQAYVQLSVNTQLLCYYIIFGFKTVVLDSWSINILILFSRAPSFIPCFWWSLCYSSLLFSFLCCVFCFICLYVLCLVYPILPVSLDCPFLICPSLFSNVYLSNKRNKIVCLNITHHTLKL